MMRFTVLITDLPGHQCNGHAYLRASTDALRVQKIDRHVLVQSEAYPGVAAAYNL